jgi:hypothetical protein
VIATDLRPLPPQSGPTDTLDALNARALAGAVNKYKATQIYHLAAILSATGERGSAVGLGYKYAKSV